MKYMKSSVFIIIILFVVQIIFSAEIIKSDELSKYSYFDTMVKQSSSLNNYSAKINIKNLSSDNKILLRNTILFSTLSIVPFGAGTGFLIGLIVWPIIDNIQSERDPITKVEGQVPREVPGFVIGSIFASIMYGMGVFFIVMSVLNAIKLKKALNEDKVSFFIDSKYDINNNTLRTGLSIKL